MIWFIFTCYSATNILCFSHLFDRVRPNLLFFSCPMCVGFWVGLALSFLEVSAWHAEGWEHYVFALCGSGGSYIIAQVVDDSGLRLSHVKGD